MWGTIVKYGAGLVLGAGVLAGVFGWAKRGSVSYWGSISQKFWDFLGV